jgi:tetratricopeptide (TPR) repeat protein
MLCVLPNVQNSRLRASVRQKVLPNTFRTCSQILLLSMALVACALTVWTPTVEAQDSNFVKTEGKICGTVLLKSSHRALSQVAVSLKSHAAGIFRSVLTDFEGRFEVRGLPRGTYDIVVDEPGYEPARTSAQLDGPSSELVVYVRPSNPSQTEGNGYTVSVRELKIPGKAKQEYQKGLERLGKNDPAGSLNHFAKATQAFPGYFEAYYHVGVVETKLGHRTEAMQAFQRAIDLSGGGYAWADFGVGYLLYLDGKPSEAEAILRRGLEVDGNSPDGHAILGMVLLRLNRVDEAEKSARESLLRRPNFAEAYLVLADACALKHEYREQMQNLDTYLKLEPNGPASQRVRQAREAVLKILAESHPSD